MHRESPRSTGFHSGIALLRLFFGVLLAAAAMLARPSQANAQSAEKIVGQYLRAMGGAKALENIQSARWEGVVHETGAESTGSYTLILKSPDKFYSELIVGSERFTEAFNGKSAWAQDSSTGAYTLTGSGPALAAASGRIWNGRLVNARQEKIEIRRIGMDTIAGRPAYHLALSFLSGAAGDIFINAQTHLLVREILVARGQAKPSTNSEERVEYDYSDYRPVDGILTPYSVVIRREGRDYLVSVTRVEFNSPVAGSIFDFPKLSGAPLPDIPALLRDVARNQNFIEDIQRKYTCRLTEEEEKIDPHGQIASTTVSQYDVFYIGGEEVRHLIAKNGTPLEGAEKQKEDDRFSKEFDKLEKKQAELASDPKKQQKEEEEDQAQVSDFLRAERFTNPRRERFRGQDVIVFDFGPNPDYKPRNLVESIVQKMVGVVWVDEKARDVVRLEARFSENAKIAGGLLASLSKGSNFVFEQSMVNNEVWLPVYTEVHASGRVLFLREKANLIDRYSDYKKFEVETHVGAPAGSSAQAPSPPK